MALAGRLRQHCCARQRVEEERARPFGDSPASLHLFETDLCGLTGLLGRRGCRPQSHAIGLRPHMSPPDADEGSNRNDNKRQGYRIPHSKFSLCDLGSLGPGRNGEDQNMVGPVPVFTVTHYLYYRRGGALSLFHLCIFRERSRYLHDTFVLSPARRSPWTCPFTPSDAREWRRRGFLADCRLSGWKHSKAHGTPIRCSAIECE